MLVGARSSGANEPEKEKGGESTDGWSASSFKFVVVRGLNPESKRRGPERKAEKERGPRR